MIDQFHHAQIKRFGNLMEEQLLVALASYVLLIPYGKWVIIKEACVKISLRMAMVLVLGHSPILGHSLIPILYHYPTLGHSLTLILYHYPTPDHSLFLGHSLFLDQDLSLVHLIADKVKFISHPLKHV
jgi:hypothetical protein